ncbi:MAG: MATE family efflux transporter [Finegoldia sp.]|nr:MATE family efflux transporter [Finegoldia sp.]
MNKTKNLLEGNIWQALIRLSLPLAATAFIQMTYNLVDMIWIGRIGTDAVAAVGICGIINWIATALTLIPRSGMGILSSQAYGKGDYKRTTDIFKNGYIIAVMVGLIYTAVILIFKKFYIGFFGLNDQVSSLANDYLSILGVGIIFTFLNPVFSQTFNSLGDSTTPFKINAIGLFFNLFLDPLLIFGLGPLPAFGIKGAAFATATSQFLVSLIFIYAMKKKDAIISQSLNNFKINKSIFEGIISLGVPASIISSLHAIISIVLNKFMSAYGAEPVAAYSIGNQLESITWMTVDGIQVAISALIAQNFGAGNIERVKDGKKVSLRLVTILGVTTFFILYAFRRSLIRAFVPNDQKTMILGVKYLEILAFSQPFVSLEIGSAGVFNGLSDTRTPAIVSTVLNLARIPMSILLMPFMGVYGIWLAISLSSLGKGLVNFGLLQVKFKKVF